MCDRLGPPQIRACFATWLARLPLPLTDADRQAGTLSPERGEQVVQPTVSEDGHRAPGLWFGPPRTMALLAALVLLLPLPHGLTHRTLRPLVAAYLGLPPAAYPPGQMTYDLRRLRLKGRLARIPHTQRSQVTTEGHRVARFFTRLHARVFRPGCAAFDPTEPIPRPLADAFAEVNRQIDLLLDSATLAPAA